MHDLQIVVVIEFVARQNAELVAGPEQRDWNHQGADECESVALSECKFLCHVRILRPERADPARWLLKRTGTGRAPRKGAAEAAAACLADPVSGLIDGDPEPVQDAVHRERDWFALEGRWCSTQVFHLSRGCSSACFLPLHPPSGV